MDTITKPATDLQPGDTVVAWDGTRHTVNAAPYAEDGMLLAIIEQEPVPFGMDATVTVEDTPDAVPAGDRLARLITEALTAAREAGRTSGRYTAGAIEVDAGDLQAAYAEADRASVAMWGAFYDYASDRA